MFFMTNAFLDLGWCSVSVHSVSNATQSNDISIPCLKFLSEIRLTKLMSKNLNKSKSKNFWLFISISNTSAKATTQPLSIVKANPSAHYNLKSCTFKDSS